MPVYEFATYLFSYSNNQLIKSTLLVKSALLDKNEFTELQYNGDKIIKAIMYDNNNKIRETTFYYDANILSYVIILKGKVTERKEFNYNNSNKVIVTYRCIGDNSCKDQNQGKYSYIGNNISKFTEKFFVGESKHEYLYDDKKSPYTNMKKYIRIYSNSFFYK